MNFSIILCHWRTGKMTAYSISQIVKYKGNHNVEILICDNDAGDGSYEYLRPFEKYIRYFEYPKDKLQSHGIGYDFLMEHASNEWVIAMESDSFPVREGWLDYYVRLINQGYDGAASLLQLSGGKYGHPAGALYRRSVWIEAWKYTRTCEYLYFPNIAMKGNLACHLMVHESIADVFMKSPEDYIELSGSYKPYSAELAREKLVHYAPVCGVFHNGMGRLQESLQTYGLRNIETEVPNILLDNRAKMIYRAGYEPGQHLFYWQLAKRKRIAFIPTETKWLPGKEGQQQEYTLTENGVKHLWAISAYHDYTPENEKDVAELKRSIPDQLYDTIPENFKIK